MSPQSRHAGPTGTAIWVPGQPRPQGSKLSHALMRNGRPILDENGRPIVATRESSKHLSAWRASVREAAKSAWLERAPLAGPVALEILFLMRRPKAHFRTGRYAGELKASAPLTHTSQPDLDKLLRAVKDALSQVVYVDDSQVCRIVARKEYGTPRRPSGVAIGVFPVG